MPLVLCRPAPHPQVVVRVRPPLPRELQGFHPFQNAALTDPSKRLITVSENLAALQNNGVENGLVSGGWGRGAGAGRAAGGSGQLSSDRWWWRLRRCFAASRGVRDGLSPICTHSPRFSPCPCALSSQPASLPGTSIGPTARRLRPQVYSSYRFGFDRVYGPDSTQEEVYAESARGAVLSVLQGYNASIVAYGQVGALGVGGCRDGMDGGGGGAGWRPGRWAGGQSGRWVGGQAGLDTEGEISKG